jgi:hypothetical protein
VPRFRVITDKGDVDFEARTAYEAISKVRRRGLTVYAVREISADMYGAGSAYRKREV